MDEKGLTGPTIVLGGADRRAADRITYNVEAHLRQGENVVVARTENVSASGVFLGVPSLLAVGSRVHVRFALPAGEFEAHATIVRMRPTTGERGPGIGLMFHELSPEHQARLDAFCPPAKPIVRHGPG
jgi:hypothetical protein